MPTSRSIFPAYDNGRPRRDRTGGTDMDWKLSADGLSVVESDAPDPIVGAGNAGRDAAADPGTVEGEAFDPSSHNIEDVKTYVTENPAERDAVLDAEIAGKDRSTLVAWLEGFGSTED